MKRIFVVGFPRSGTTLLQSLLIGGGELVSFTESHFFKRGFNFFCRRKGDKKELCDLIKNFIKDNDSVTFENEEVSDSCQKNSVSNDGIGFLFISMLDIAAENKNKSGWVEKTPDHIFRIRVIEKFAQGAKFIHIIRDPVEAIKSIKIASQLWGKNRTVLSFSLKWVFNVCLSFYYSGKPNHYIIFYDDLTENTGRSLERVYSFVGLKFSSFVLDNYQNSVSSVILKNEKWKANNTKEIYKSSANYDVCIPKLYEVMLRKIYSHLKSNIKNG